MPVNRMVNMILLSHIRYDLYCGYSVKEGGKNSIKKIEYNRMEFVLLGQFTFTMESPKKTP